MKCPYCTSNELIILEESVDVDRVVLDSNGELIHLDSYENGIHYGFFTACCNRTLSYEKVIEYLKMDNQILNKNGVLNEKILES